MPYYSELGLTSLPSSSAYSSLLLAGPYSNHSSLIASNFVPYSKSRPLPRGYKPHLSTIKEFGSPLRRVDSPKISYQTTPHVRLRPIKVINTADIDVSKNRFRKFDKYEKPKEIKPLEKTPSPKIEEADAKPNPTITRDRATVRLRTIHRDTLERELGEIRSWRDNFQPHELAVEEKRVKKTPGEILKEKFLIRSKSKENLKLERRKSIKKSPSFHDICQAISSDTIADELNPGQPPEVQRRQSRRCSTDDIIKEINRTSSSLSEAELQLLDVILQEQEKLDAEQIKDENHLQTRSSAKKKIHVKKKVTKYKSKDKIESPSNISKPAENVEKEINDPQTRFVEIMENDKLDHLSDVSEPTVFVDKIRDISLVDIQQTTFKPKTIITSSVGEIEEFKSPLKAVVEEVEVVESPKIINNKKTKFTFTVDVKEEKTKAKKRSIEKKEIMLHTPKSKDAIVSKVLKKQPLLQVGNILKERDIINKIKAGDNMVECTLHNGQPEAAIISNAMKKKTTAQIGNVLEAKVIENSGKKNSDNSDAINTQELLKADLGKTMNNKGKSKNISLSQNNKTQLVKGKEKPVVFNHNANNESKVTIEKQSVPMNNALSNNGIAKKIDVPDTISKSLETKNIQNTDIVIKLSPKMKQAISVEKSSEITTEATLKKLPDAHVPSDVTKSFKLKRNGELVENSTAIDKTPSPPHDKIVSVKLCKDDIKKDFLLKKTSIEIDASEKYNGTIDNNRNVLSPKLPELKSDIISNKNKQLDEKIKSSNLSKSHLNEFPLTKSDQPNTSTSPLKKDITEQLVSKKKVSSLDISANKKWETDIKDAENDKISTNDIVSSPKLIELSNEFIKKGTLYDLNIPQLGESASKETGKPKLLSQLPTKKSVPKKMISKKVSPANAFIDKQENNEIKDNEKNKDFNKPPPSLDKQDQKKITSKIDVETNDISSSDNEIKNESKDRTLNERKLGEDFSRNRDNAVIENNDLTSAACRILPEPNKIKDTTDNTPNKESGDFNFVEKNENNSELAAEGKLDELNFTPTKKLISKRSLIYKANKVDPDLEVFDIPDEPENTRVEEQEKKEVFLPLQSNRISQWMHPWKKPEQYDVCPVEIFARPKVIRGRHYPRPRGHPAPSSPDEEEDDDDEEEEETDDESSTAESNSSSSDEEETECGKGANSGEVGASTSSVDSGFGSGAVCKKECDVNIHKKCESLTANLCGVNQKLLVEAIESARKESSDNRDSPARSHSNNSELAICSENIPEELSQSSTFAGFQKTGRITPPATTIPRFRKYCVEDFNFLKVLGKGSFGKVLLAELKGTDYYYAVKCLKKDIVLEDDDVECTLIERKVLALGTKHPYLCHLLCTFQTDSHLFFVMEYLNGGDLMFHIQAAGRFPEYQARFYGAEIVSGLKFLHSKGIVYRDLKLDNVLLDFDGHVRIADFGMCKLQIFLDRMAESFCGTPDYMAPEIIKGLHYNQCVDWWSFGVLLYEMLLGQSPFSGCDEDELFWSICNEKPVLPKFLSSEATQILLMLLEKEASKRLGNRFSPHGDIQDHAFFKAIDWYALETRQLEPPFKPHLNHPLDTQYFDKHFTVEQAKLTPTNSTVLQSIDQTGFQGFSYTNPNATDK